MTADTDIAARLCDLVGADAVLTGDAADRFALDGLKPLCAGFPTSVEQTSRCLATAHAADLAVIPVGNGTQLHIGRRPARYDLALSTQRLTRILAHEAADMTATVEAGLTLGALNAELARAGQQLPVDPPHPDRTTIGALIATDACGPLRLAHGKVRDLLIGITVVLADGTAVHGGGRVVKNVAGYDLMKLFTGSFGTLGIIVEATFKLRPLPQREAVFVLTAADGEASLMLAADVRAAQLAPHYVTTVNRAAAACVGLDGPAVVVGCGGTAEEIAAQRDRLADRTGRGALRVLDVSDAARLYAAVRDFPAARSLPLASRPLGLGAGDEVCGCKVSMLPSHLGPLLARIEEEGARRGLETAMLAHAGNGVAFIRFGTAANGALLPFAEWLGAGVRAAGGWVVFDLLPSSLKAQIDPWGPQPPGIGLMRGIKQTLDPRKRLSPGRFVGGI